MVGARAFAALGFAFASTLSGAALAEGSIIGLGPGFYWDEGERRDEAEPDTGGAEGSEELESDGYANLQLWYLREAFEQRVLWGGGIAWHNNYAVVPTDADDGNDDVRQYGHLFQLYVEGDLLVPISSKLDLVLGARLGMLTLFQSRDLQDELDELSDLGYSVWPSMPRLGAFLGPHVGVIWPFSDRIALRSDFGVQFSKLWLFSGEAEVGGASYERSATLDTTRMQILLGLHVSF